jgi:ubiquinone/menaquinone biosynthesis C-methylase UbiE
MSAQRALKHGDFTGLAENYARYRPSYSADVLSAILGMIGKPASTLAVADIGAGTGIWTRLLADRKPASITAVEPNDDMRAQGAAAGGGIEWKKGSGEATGLSANSFDLVSMASSFHWVDFAAGTREFHRILKPGGVFVALWNPRYLEASPMLTEIEQKLSELNPKLSRVSSGKSPFVEELTARFANHPLFEPPLYLEGRHSMQLTQEQYIGVWNSVNDIRSQLGEEKFAQFMAYVKTRIAAEPHIDCSYLTRAWAVRVKK